MKRAVVILAVLLFAVSSMAVIGCGGGDTETAKKYMNTADSAQEKLQQDGKTLQDKALGMLMPLIQGDMSQVDLSGLPALSEELATLTGQVDTVKADYEKITTLDGVDEYVEYANAMIAYLDTYKESLEASKKMFEEFTPVLDQAVATGDTSQLMPTLMSAQSGQDEISKELDEKLGEAEKIKEENNLGE